MKNELEQALDLIEKLKSLLARNGVSDAIHLVVRVKKMVEERQQNIGWEQERGLRPPEGEDEGWENI